MKTRVYLYIGMVVLGASIAVGQRWLAQPPDEVGAAHGNFAGRFQPAPQARDQSKNDNAGERDSHIGSIQQLPSVNLSRP